MQRKVTVMDGLRLILGLAALGLAMIAMINLTTDSMPAYDRLAEISGAYVRMDREADGDNLYLYLRTDSGLTERFILNSILNVDTAAMAAKLDPGETVTVRYQNDEYRNVYELTGADGPILTYAQAEKADRENRYWGYGLVGGLTAAALGLLVFWTLRERHRRRREEAALAKEHQRRAEEAAREAARQPIVYEPWQYAAVEAYIREAFGPIAQIFHEPPAHDLRLDIAVVAPTESENFYKLVTIGMGARRMDVPPELAEKNQSYAELCVFLPPEWKLLGDDEADTWPFFWLQKIARLPIERCDWVSAGHVISAEGPLTAGFGFQAILLGWAQVRENCRNRLMLEDGQLINFYQMYPIYPTERDYQRQRGSQRLWDRMQRAGISPVTDMDRESCCDPDVWFDEDIEPFCRTSGHGEAYLGLDVPEARGSYDPALGYPADGREWQTLAAGFLGRFWPDQQSLMEFHCDEETFFAASADGEFLNLFALALHDFCEDPERAHALLEESRPR